MFIPNGYTQTLGELEDEVKKSISHRAKALELAKPIIQMLQRKR
jgi:XTP/dITP diphosphohydrolase